jgi:hypothetical protein
LYLLFPSSTGFFRQKKAEEDVTFSFFKKMVLLPPFFSDEPATGVVELTAQKLVMHRMFIWPNIRLSQIPDTG